MKQIMRRKQMANAARKELDSSAGGKSTSQEKKSGEIPARKASSSVKYSANHDNASREMPPDEKETTVSPMDKAMHNSQTLSLDEKDTSVWVMLGNHLNESTDKEQSSEFAITPAKWIRQNIGDGGSNVSNSSGASGVLSFLGESPLFDQSVADESEAKRNLQSSAEKVKKLEERLLQSPDGMLSPVKPRKENDEEHGRGVTFAVQGGWETPGGPAASRNYSRYRKSPFVAHRKSTPSTPSSGLSESMEAQANPMNESAIVSDDEASGEDAAGSPSPMKGIGSDGDAPSEEERRWDEEFRAGLTPEEQGRRRGVPGVQRRVRRSPGRWRSGTPRAAQSLSAAGSENSLLRVNHELSLQENSRLKVLVESLRAQKRQAEMQVEAYRTQIADADETHRSSSKRMEDTYFSHLKNSKEQVDSLNERLRQSHDANAALQSMLDDVHGKWESKLQSDAASKALIASLKERVAASDVAAAEKGASAKAMQARIEDLQKMHDWHANQVRRERNERELVEQDRDELRDQCDSLHRQLTEWVQTSRNEDFAAGPTEYSPVKSLRLDVSGGTEGGGRDEHPRTPTSNLLARTLRSELKRRQTVAEKLESAEHRVAKLKDKLSDAGSFGRRHRSASHENLPRQMH